MTRKTNISNMTILQEDNLYTFFTPQCFPVVHIRLPADKQYIDDTITVDGIAKVLSWRWGCGATRKKGSKVVNYKQTDLKTVQTDQSAYDIYLPNGYKVCDLLTPPDADYVKDTEVLGIICKALELRYGL